MSIQLKQILYYKIQENGGYRFICGKNFTRRRLRSHLSVRCAYALPDPTGEEAKAEQERFHTYLMDNFKESVTSDTVTLHYTVANPAHYDLDVPTATFGDAEISEDAIASDKKETEDEITELQSFDYDLLTGSQKYTYDVIKDYLDLNLESYDYTYLYEPFAYTSGLQTNMPINMS